MPPMNELPIRGSKFHPRRTATPNRRQALGLLASGIASGLAACSKPAEQIIPYVAEPERLIPGEPLKFATTLPLSGYGRGVIVTSIDGRPIKVEGNPRHPASLGATDIFAEAALLSLYDPDRSRAILHEGKIASPDAFKLALQVQLQQIRQRDGEGFRLLTGRVTSPTLLRQIDDLLQIFPKATWHAYEPVDDDSAQRGAALAFGKPLKALPRLDKARVLVTLDADPLGHGPEQLVHARGFAACRQPDRGDFSRIYTIEAVPSLTGAKADHRIALQPQLIGEIAVAIANSMGASLREASLPDHARQIAAQAAADLSANRGHAMVLAGRLLPADVHALVHWINFQLEAPVDFLEIGITPGGRQAGGLPDLARDLDAGIVNQLVMIDVNPGYNAPADLEFATCLEKADFRLHLGRYVDETAAISHWHIPQTHELEAWSDLRSSDGTASLVQPLIRPLFRSWSGHELLALLTDRADASSYELVRETWRPQRGNDFEGWWSRALHDGFIAGSAPAPVKTAQPRLPDIPAMTTSANVAMTLVLKPDPSLWDGAYANNAWLQECPKSLTKQVWGNALGLNPQDAARLNLTSGDVITIATDGRHIDAPVNVEPGIADGVASLSLGHGRGKAGAIGSNIGANAYTLRTSAHPWAIPGIVIAKTGRREEILTTQNVVRAIDAVRELYPLHDLSEPRRPQPAASQTKPSLLPETPSDDDGHAWAMVIDTAVCIGCNACVVACQAENNVAVVGPEEVARGRDMHWLRVDVYDHGSAANSKPGFQPVPCMHCEHAPCEPVCPVAASVHDSEGLNLQVYNRCVGTRFCEANCPYKVRRFNFFGYADGEEYANLGFESYRAQKNPEVTVRARGVMEKCTYCVQRISATRRAAERNDRPVGLDEVKTACQSACPTSAITFGDLRQKDAAVRRLKADPRHYALLEHLGTRPRTTYLADVRNRAPGLDEEAT